MEIIKKRIFNNKNLTIILDDKANLWFLLNEITNILNYEGNIIDYVDYKYLTIYSELQNSNNIISKLCDNLQDRSKFISKPGIYQLLMKADFSLAIMFQKWFYDDFCIYL